MGIFGKGAVKDIVEDVSDTVNKFNTKEQATRRAEADMMSDTKLSKNIRPIVMLVGLSLLAITIILEACGVNLEEKILETVFWVAVIPLGYYFPGRSVEKWVDRKYKK